jgi:hypothetical protein
MVGCAVPQSHEVRSKTCGIYSFYFRPAWSHRRLSSCSRSAADAVVRDIPVNCAVPNCHRADVVAAGALVAACPCSPSQRRSTASPANYDSAVTSNGRGRPLRRHVAALPLGRPAGAGARSARCLRPPPPAADRGTRGGRSDRRLSATTCSSLIAVSPPSRSARSPTTCRIDRRDAGSAPPLAARALVRRGRRPTHGWRMARADLQAARRARAVLRVELGHVP